MALKGMDVDGGRQTAAVLDQGAGELDSLTQQLGAAIKGFDWLGPDADRTRSQWDGEQTRMLQAVSQSLRDFSQLIKTQAQDQEQASN